MQASCTPNMTVSINFVHLAYQTGGILHNPPYPYTRWVLSSTLVMTTSLNLYAFFPSFCQGS